MKGVTQALLMLGDVGLSASFGEYDDLVRLPKTDEFEGPHARVTARRQRIVLVCLGSVDKDVMKSTFVDLSHTEGLICFEDQLDL